jgi:hypothetical protein
MVCLADPPRIVYPPCDSLTGPVCCSAWAPDQVNDLQAEPLSLAPFLTPYYALAFLRHDELIGVNVFK